jgi:hypothetical chaperone protein
MQFIGIDFGTSNSLASIVKNDKIEFVRFLDNNISNPSLIYFPEKSGRIDIGTAAVENYLDDLEEGRPVGRLMLSIKTLLPDAKFDHTIVIGHGKQTAAGLVAKFIKVIKHLAETQFAAKFDGVVLGRPVDFSELAISRLEEAARAAGFKEVVFWLEPVAAAMDYERQSVEDELLCVVDIGGGTSDICIIETSPSRAAKPDRITDIKATSGVNLAGDAFSSEIMRHRLAERFGDGSTFKSLGKTLPFPVHIINTLNRWHRIHQLNDAQTLPGLASIMVSSDRPDDVERLIKLITNNYGYELFRAIDNAKKDLTINDLANVKFRPLSLNQEIQIDDFENLIRPAVTKIEDAVYQCLNSASVKPTKIKKVLLTGGSSQVPLMNRAICRIFGEEKIIRPDFFSSIATGLGYVAARLN